MSERIPADSMRVPYPFRGHPGVAGYEVTTTRDGRDIVETFTPIPAELFASGDPIDGLDAWETDGGYIPAEASCATS